MRAALYIMLSKPKASDFIFDDIIKYFPRCHNIIPLTGKLDENLVFSTSRCRLTVANRESLKKRRQEWSSAFKSLLPKSPVTADFAP